MTKQPTLEELKQLANEGRCLNCGKWSKVMIPLYQQGAAWWYHKIQEQFGLKELDWFIEHAGICPSCSNL